MTRDEAIRIGVRLLERKDGTIPQQTEYRQGITDFLDALAGAGAFEDGRNMQDRLMGTPLAHKTEHKA